jgi:glyoxylase-like metal-dependent hydrolase (beta-lactamase superfamily II)
MKVHTIDLQFQGVTGVIAAYLLESEGEVALVETGPMSTIERLVEGISECGLEWEQVRKVFVTHVHLDHAGAVGWWAERGAQVFCHPRARRHLIDPGRLVAGAREVYGAAYDSLWGEMTPAPADSVIALEDGDSVGMGGEMVTAIDTPGHARHHHVFAVGDVCFAGDAAGVRLGGCSYQSVAAAPPQFELMAYLRSVRKLREFAFRRLYLTHFGGIDDVDDHLRVYLERLQAVAGEARRSMGDGEGDGEWQVRFEGQERALARSSGVSEGLWGAYQLANGTTMCADGLRLWASQGGV